MSEKANQALVTALLERAGQTYADEAGIRLRDQPAPLYQLLVLATLLSARISAGVAVSAARELFAAGFTTPDKMRRANWQQRVDALGRGHYRRYDERTATMLGNGAELILDRYRGDLRRLAKESKHDRDRAAELLQEVPGIGPVGADIFLREAQAVWQWLRPFADRRVAEGARRLGLPTDPADLARLVDGDNLARLAAGLVRVSLDQKLATAVQAQADAA
jgi:endonuclease III